ncbi:MAG: hypothetical protein AB8B52_02405 [Winogradskyella sp.]|uniref:hypothetical protein n=1 Tax=Winogradskyella sp. TaxID=1883156 RepID=UPI00385953D4
MDHFLAQLLDELDKRYINKDFDIIGIEDCNVISLAALKKLREIQKEYNSKTKTFSSNRIDESFSYENFSLFIKYNYINKNEGSGKNIKSKRIDDPDLSDICQISRAEYLKNHLNKGNINRKRFQDLYALALGYNGYRDFVKQKKLLGQPIRKEHQVKFNSPLDNELIKSLFVNDCYLYTYSEAIGKPDQDTNYKDINFPTIDALVVQLNSLNNTFEIKNIQEEDNHSEGIISWAGKTDGIAFDINFPQKDRSLHLRFHIPSLHQNHKDVYILLGTFSFVHFTGLIVRGTVVLEKQNEKQQIEPYKYKFSFNNQSDNEPPPEIQKLLFDRYLNWSKMKGNIYNHQTLKNWIKKREKNEYIRTKKRDFKYLITYPVTSLETTLQNKIGKSFERVIDDFKQNNSEPSSDTLKRLLRKNNYHDHGSLKNLIKTIDENLKNDKHLIELFPLSKDNISSENKIDLNKAIFDSINRAVTVVIVIPNGEYLKKSSVYTIAGYSIALRKKTFILHQDQEDLPLVIQENIKSMGLYVYQYETIEELPFLFYLKNPINSKFKV